MSNTVRKVLALFEPADYPGLYGIVIALIVTGLLQTAGIASIMPFLAVVSNPAVIRENPYLAWAYETLGFRSTEGFLMALGLSFLAVMVASNSAAALTTWATVRVQWRTHQRLSQRLLEQYLRAPYSYHLNQNSARLGKTLLLEVNRVISDVFVPGTRLLARGVAAILIVAFLIWADPPLALLLSFVIGGFYALVYLFVRRKQQRLGEEASLAKTERFQIVNEAFGGIKDLKVLGREEHFLTRFSGPSERFSRAYRSNGVVGLIPRFALETLAYGSLVVVILYLLQTRNTLDQIFPLVAVYALGASRLIPAVQEIFQALMQIKFGSAALDSLHADLHGLEGSRLPGSGRAPAGPVPPAGPEAPVRLERGIRLQEVTFTYPGAPLPSVQGVSLEIPVNMTLAFVGPTGSGKTTLVDLLLGLFQPTEGAILIDDVVLDAESLPAWRRKVGYVPQSIFLCDTSVTRNIAFGVPDQLIDHDAVRRAAQVAHLDSFVATLPSGYDTMVGERGVRLSGGQRQRIGIARALYHDPDVLILDEATSALDNVTEEVVLQAIRELTGRRTIILIAHRLTTVRECAMIYFLDRGRVIAQGSYDALVTSNPTFRALAKA